MEINYKVMRCSCAGVVMSLLFATAATNAETSVINNPEIQEKSAPKDVAALINKQLKMDQATPMEWPEYVPSKATDEKESDGGSGSMDSQLAPIGANDDAKALYPEAWQAMEEMEQMVINEAVSSSDLGTSSAAEPDLYTGYPANLYTQSWKYHPWRTMGKLYFNTPSGGTSYCSASMLKNNVLLTAAHCVYSRGSGWHSNLVFAPAERYGNRPYGQYNWTGAIVLTNWINIGSRQYDLALVRLSGNPNGMVGNLGYAYGQSFEQSLFSFGYPGNLGSGQYSNTCAAESFKDDTDAIGMGCNMTYGSSGGPWLRLFSPYVSGGNQANSVVSGPSIKGTFGQSYVGPRFTSNNFQVLCNSYGCL
jgi:V8-like Glu-specific endopeptidase